MRSRLAPGPKEFAFSADRRPAHRRHPASQPKHHPPGGGKAPPGRTTQAPNPAPTRTGQARPRPSPPTDSTAGPPRPASQETHQAAIHNTPRAPNGGTPRDTKPGAKTRAGPQRERPARPQSTTAPQKPRQGSRGTEKAHKAKRPAPSAERCFMVTRYSNCLKNLSKPAPLLLSSFLPLCPLPQTTFFSILPRRPQATPVRPPTSLTSLCRVH